VTDPVPPSGPALPHPLTGALHVSPVPPGTGWPDDPADAATLVALDADDVRSLARDADGLATLCGEVSVCRACPRLVAWREGVAAAKRRAYVAEPYWGRPIAGWGDERPSLLIVGLAPAVHGGNRTGRVFTGDRSGDWLFASLHRIGYASAPTSVHAGDGQRLIGARMVAAVRCAPPGNRPTIEERDTCAPWLLAELAFVADSLEVAVCLGSYGWESAVRALRAHGYAIPRPRPGFGHAAEALVDRPGRRPLLLLGSYHPSQQNTFTRKLTEPMLDAVFERARRWTEESRG
jgi:uracil-DNA glycosylase